jgi:hypothetical protein
MMVKALAGKRTALPAPPALLPPYPASGMVLPRD